MSVFRCCQVGCRRALYTCSGRFEFTVLRPSCALLGVRPMSSVIIPESKTLHTKTEDHIIKSQPYLKFRNLSRHSSTSTEGAPEGTLIYTGPVTGIVKAVKFFSLSTSMMTAAILPWYLKVAGNDVLTYIASLLGIAVFITPVLLHALARTYVTRMYYNAATDTYTAVTVTFILRDKYMAFTPNDVEVPGITNLLTTFKAKGRSLLVDPMAFTNPNDYNHIMGYDKFERIDLEKLKKELEEKED
ncbi:transmembrane protein 70, mitochondrial-like [Saccoglossus kowalevskii]|uniref:Transmembrane protein 70, mitochondrial-like n=1 Tax=Saccoglossus kowalevskii TaxID=10224 RepID=A0ABM0H1P7_SACKO|nr:PREDICTED: transmembrane protein 70, mitochondrial-like [Saccoglossus kowalevskii]